MATKYYAVLTNVGAAKLANATALGAQVEITQMAVGDGNGVLPTPNPAQTALVHELRRKPLNSLSIDPNNANQIIAEQVIPEDEGGWWIREIGLFDKDGDMIAVANCAETYKPQLQEGSGRVQVVRMILIVSSTAAVTLKIDPSVVLATRQYVDDQIIQVKSYVDQKMAAHVAAADPHKQYAPKESPALTGRPTAPTAEGKDSSTQIANTAFVQAAIAALVGSSPEALDTLNELAAALGNDPNFATTVTNSLAGKMDKSANGSDIENVSVFLQNLGLGEAAKRDVGTGDNQIPDMGAFASGSGWFRLPGGYIVQFGTFAGNTTRFISGHFPIPFPNQPMVSVSVMSDAVQSDPSNPAPQVLSVNFEHISNSAWRVATSDISYQYRFSYISIGR
ncbi:phage tail protein [Salmonella enterica]|uniref:phage tail protein n=1 Tax=Escherichia coli TaxID=562 RepID=UPI0017DA6CA9|nr:phage tail protein [Escherichia coli]EHA4351109.1 phage tail protein [Salmonella enterica]EKX5682331.1 phage tail protein [Citrobacter freundii]EFL9540013.1 phage tail protein [Escherichia coli]EGV1935918.1 phage tail protein [Escherichia coli]EHY5952967.1 phage tail protein [Escherichia coli]